MTFAFRCPRTGAEFERWLTGDATRLRQPCDDCTPECPVQWIAENNRVFTTYGVVVPRPRFKGGYDAHTHKRFANGAARERYMEKNNLTLERG